jgi:uncharacterized protein YebE (UPF0316 family)
MIWCEVLRKDVNDVNKIIRDIDPSAFITAEEIRLIQRGYWRK